MSLRVWIAPFYRVLLLLILVSLTSVTVLADDVSIVEIKVLDNQFKEIRTITNKDELLKAQKAWKQLIPIKDLPNSNWTHKLDIATNYVGGRWLYNKEGYIAKLNKYLEPKYKVSNVEEFNKIFLGSQ